MKLQDQVTTIEQAKRLRELGVVQYLSLFCYCHVSMGQHEDEGYSGIISRHDSAVPDEAVTFICDMFTTSELGVALGYRVMCPTNANEAEYRAAKLIEDLENFVYTVDQVNQRLSA